MLLITSGEYVETELQAEFGKIPPAFLPVGNKRLYTYQVDQLRKSYERVCLTIPDDFELDRADTLYLDKHDICLFRTAAGAPLGTAVRDFLVATKTEGRIDILYGDTLIGDALDAGDAGDAPGALETPGAGSTNWLAVGDSDENYHWHQEKPHNGQPGGTWAGMFSFGDAALLCRTLGQTGDFIPAVGRYGELVGQMQHKVVRKWLDFGHIHTYFDSKREITTQRHFNQLRVADGVLTKSSTDTWKMLAEADWFERAPAVVKPFLPNFIARKETQPAGYLLEYLHLAALNELYVFGRLPPRVWKKIFAACDTFLQAASQVPLPSPLAQDFSELTYSKKTLSRLTQFSGQTGISLDMPWRFNGQQTPSLHAMAQEAAHAVLSRPGASAFIHGDFCFSNILFDFRAGRVKIVDPRGIDAQGKVTPFGDMRYEVGKLAHSVLGLYDFLIAGFFTLEIDGNAVAFDIFSGRGDTVRTIFLDTTFVGRKPVAWDCYPVMLLLFLSMLPLHVDNPLRQKALMANCLKLYMEWKHDYHTDGGTEQSFYPSGLYTAKI